jgi:hypothetical protein
MALIGKSAGQSNLWQRGLTIAQESFRLLNALMQKPSMWRGSGGLPESAREMTAR